MRDQTIHLSARLSSYLLRSESPYIAHDLLRASQMAARGMVEVSGIFQEHY